MSTVLPGVTPAGLAELDPQPPGTGVVLLAAVDEDRHGMGLLVTELDSIGTLTVTRITESGRQVVRGLDHVLIQGVSTYGVVDYEMPLDSPVFYEMEWIGSTPVTQTIPGSGVGYMVGDLLGEHFILRNLFLSSSQVAVDWTLGVVPSEDITIRGGIFSIIGRPDPIVVVDTKESTAGVLNVITLNRDATETVRTILDNANPLLLQVPDEYDIGTEGVLYLQPTKTTVRRPLGDARRPERVYEISYVQITPPAATVVFAVAGVHYQEIYESYASYRALLRDSITYEDRTYYDIVYGSEFGYI